MKNLLKTGDGICILDKNDREICIGNTVKCQVDVHGKGSDFEGKVIWDHEHAAVLLISGGEGSSYSFLDVAMSTLEVVE